MKLSDIFSLNLNSKGGAKLFKKIANKYNLDYKQVRKSVEENTDKYGYYKLNKALIPNDFKKEGLCELLALLLNYTKYVEINGITSFDRVSGVCGFVNTDASYAIKLFQNKPDEFAYVGGEYFNVGLKICENDITYISFMNEKYYTHVISGTICDRINNYDTFIPITKEEYEHLSDGLKI